MVWNALRSSCGISWSYNVAAVRTSSLLLRDAPDEAVDHRPVEPVADTIGSRLASEHGDVEQQRAVARWFSLSSTPVIRNRRHTGADSVSAAPSGRPPGRLSTVIVRRSSYDLVELHGGGQAAQSDGGQVGALGEAFDELECRHSHDGTRLGDRRLVAGERQVGLQHALDDPGDRVLDAEPFSSRTPISMLDTPTSMRATCCTSFAGGGSR